MIETSATYKTLLAKGARAEVSLVIGSGGHLITSEGKRLVIGKGGISVGRGSADGGVKMDKLRSLTITQVAMDEGSFSLGGAFAAEIDVELYGLTGEIPKMAELKPYVRLTDGEQTSEWIPQGVFYVDSREVDNPDGLKIIRLHGYDAMLKGEQNMPTVGLAWPMSSTAAARTAAQAMGVELDPRTLTRLGGTLSFSVPTPIGYSCREVLQSIAGACGGSFVMSQEGKLLLITLWDTQGAQTAEALGTPTAGKALTGWTGVRINLSDTAYAQWGDDSGRLLETTSIYGDNAQAKDLFDKIKAVTYQPFTADKVLLDPAAELGDRVTVGTVTGTVWRATRTLGPMYLADVSAPGEAEINHEYPYASTQDREQTRRYSSLRAALSVMSDKITAMVESEGGDESFGWTLTDKKWEISANGTPVLTATKAGLEISGIIKALAGGSIGGLDITEDSLSTNGMDFANSAELTQGIYLGPDGLRVGKDFFVDMNGNLTAYSATVETTVHARDIVSDGAGDYIDNDIIETGSLNAWKIVANDIGTDRTDYDINEALSYAVDANNYFNGRATADYIQTDTLRVTSYTSIYTDLVGGVRKVDAEYLVINGHGYNVLVV